MTPLTLLTLIFAITYASVEGGNTRNLQGEGFYYSDTPTEKPTESPNANPVEDGFYYSDTPTEKPTESPNANPVEDGFYYSDTPTERPTESPNANPVQDEFFYEDSPTESPTPDNFNYFGDYYFDYENDGASCGREERFTIRDLTGFFADTVDLLRNIESECGTSGACIQGFFNSSDLSFDCVDCFTEFIFDMSLACPSQCFDGEDFSESACIDCLEINASTPEIQFEACVGLDLIPDDEFDVCVERLEAEENIDLPQVVQRVFNDFCKDADFSFVEESNCLTFELSVEFQVDQDCAECLRDHAICINEFCSGQCEFGDLSDCIGCVENNRCASDFDECSGLNLYFRGNGYNDFGNDYDYDYNDGGNIFFDTIITFLNDFFFNFIEEFINSLSNILLGN